MELDSFERKLMHTLTLGFVSIQRPFVLFTMGLSTVAFFELGIWAIIKVILMFVSGEAALQEGASILQAIALILIVLVGPFLLSWGSAKMAKKALAQIRKDGWIYKE